MGWPGKEEATTSVKRAEASSNEKEGEKKKEKKNSPRIRNTSKGIVPRQERCQNAKDTTSLLQAFGGRRCAIVVGVLGASQEKECQVQGEEEHEEHDSRAQRADQQDKGEDEPARQEETQHARHIRCRGIRVRNAQRGRQDEGVGDPEATVRREGGGTESVADGHFPRKCELT